MGKYNRKRKIVGEATALMDVSPFSIGVLTRAKSLALQRHLQNPSSFSSSLPTSPTPPSKQKQMSTDCGGSYLQLRSNRIQKKPPVIRTSKRRKQQRRKLTCGQNPNPNPQISDSLVRSIRESIGDGSRSDSIAESAVFGKEKVGLIREKKLNGEINKNPCFEKNFLELEGSESFNKTSRESTPSSLSTKLSNCIGEESLLGSHRHLPTTSEMDEFFCGAEEEQQKQFIDKYNFDPVNEQPLPGRFEWKKVDD